MAWSVYPRFILLIRSLRFHSSKINNIKNFHRFPKIPISWRSRPRKWRVRHFQHHSLIHHNEIRSLSKLKFRRNLSLYPIRRLKTSFRFPQILSRHLPRCRLLYKTRLRHKQHSSRHDTKLRTQHLKSGCFKLQNSSKPKKVFRNP